MYQQATLPQCDAELPVQTIIRNCVLTTTPRYSNRRRDQQWICTAHAASDVWHPSRNETYILRAAGAQARIAHAARLGISDRVDIRGIPRQREVPLQGGRMTTVTYLTVLSIQSISHEQRWLNNHQTFRMRYLQTHQRGME